MSVPLLEVHDLAVRYPTGELALHHVSFEIKSPSFMAIIGPNGSGKSTFIKTSLGLIK
ncbi:MAG: ATP-binding cassette domain-containing protein, partial [Candidatus Thorarchaeota archaeon]|nr:ATP-binding cassette domain-containing protein [Candidatus Thorarchaeota archaeon]